MKLGIIGSGFVGKASYILESKGIDMIVYDIKPELCNPLGTTLNEIVLCDLIFICVPTPMNKNGSCCLKIVESVVEDISQLCNLDKSLVVLRSTIPPSTANRLNCYFMPEFLTEKNYEQDFKNNRDWIFGLKNTSQDALFKEKISQLINTACENKVIKYNNITFVPNSEAEMIKLFRNNFLALKVSFCNEIEEFCSKNNLDYKLVSEIATKDLRIGGSHIKVPGPDGRRGFGGTCFPKDSHNLLNLFNKSGITSYIIKSMVNRNNTVDRSEQDWKNDKGRACI